MDEKIVKDSQVLAKDLVNDCISRQAAIERATRDHDFYKGATTPADMARRDELLNVMCWLGELPSAQSERKQGHWVGIDDEPCETWECDQCGYIQECFDGEQPNYCPNCGADMREVNE